MSGYITFWSKEYVKEIEKHNDKGPFSVVYGSKHTRMPSISALKIGDIVYPVAIKDKTLCIMARLEIEDIEPTHNRSCAYSFIWKKQIITEAFAIRQKW